MKLWIASTVLLAMLLGVGCSKPVPEFSVESPFAVEFKRVREAQDAIDIVQRLQGMKVPAYAVLLSDTLEIEDNWYLVLAGAMADSAEAALESEQWAAALGLSDLKVVDYHTWAGLILPLPEPVEGVVPEVNKPQVNSEEVYKLLTQFPSDSWFDVKKITLFSLDTSIMPRGAFKQLYDAKLDLPRGINRRMVVDHSLAFAEVILEDNLFGDQVTIDVMRLRDNPPARTEPRAILTAERPDTTQRTVAEMSWYFAAAILNTGEYDTEAFEEITVQSQTPLAGYKVVIEPREEYFRTYWILIDEAAQYLWILQSTAKTDDQMLALIGELGKASGMMDYDDFRNSFYTLPHCLDSNDVFVGFESEILTRAYARERKNRNWARAMVGHNAASALYYDRSSRTNWSASLFDVSSRRKVDDIYNVMYRQDRGGKDPVDVNGMSGFYLSSFWGSYREVNYPSEGQHIVAVGGSLSKKQLIQRAQGMQVGGMPTASCE